MSVYLDAQGYMYLSQGKTDTFENVHIKNMYVYVESCTVLLSE